MFVAIVTVLFLTRYYLKQKPSLDAVGSALANDVSTDFKNVTGAVYAAGVKSREFYSTNMPKLEKMILDVRSKLLPNEKV